jgi:hypothetical protein
MPGLVAEASGSPSGWDIDGLVSARRPEQR